MHPLAAIVLVILTGLAWLGTITTLLVSLANARRQPPPGAEGNLQVQDNQPGTLMGRQN